MNLSAKEDREKAREKILNGLRLVRHEIKSSEVHCEAADRKCKFCSYNKNCGEKRRRKDKK